MRLSPSQSSSEAMRVYVLYLDIFSIALKMGCHMIKDKCFSSIGFCTLTVQYSIFGTEF